MKPGAAQIAVGRGLLLWVGGSRSEQRKTSDQRQLELKDHKF